MKHLNVEIKARCENPEKVRKILTDLHADFRGVDEQTDTYFHCGNGRLKLRQGNIENNLIHYLRADSAAPKASEVTLLAVQDGDGLREILSKAYGVKIVVKKRREIYFIENVKFHIDELEELGSFVEIEAIDSDGNRTEKELREQCTKYLQAFGIQKKDLIKSSYSDMIAQKTTKQGKKS